MSKSVQWPVRSMMASQERPVNTVTAPRNSASRTRMAPKRTQGMGQALADGIAQHAARIHRQAAGFLVGIDGSEAAGGEQRQHQAADARRQMPFVHGLGGAAGHEDQPAGPDEQGCQEIGGIADEEIQEVREPGTRGADGVLDMAPGFTAVGEAGILGAVGGEREQQHEPRHQEYPQGRLLEALGQMDRQR